MTSTFWPKPSYALKDIGAGLCALGASAAFLFAPDGTLDSILAAGALYFALEARREREMDQWGWF